MGIYGSLSIPHIHKETEKQNFNFIQDIAFDLNNSMSERLNGKKAKENLS